MIWKYSKIIIAGIVSIIFIILSMIIYSKFGSSSLEIYHYVLRDRIIVTDQVMMRKSLYVSYRMKKRIEVRDGIRA